MQPLYVLYDDLVIGLLTHTQSGRLTFQYDTAWLGNVKAFPISVSMPLGSDLFPDNITRPYFSGLLPEGHMRETVARKLGISPRSDFKLLQCLGGDCAGALVISDTVPLSTEHEKEAISQGDLSNILKTYTHQPFLVDHEGIRLSLAGAQEKLPIIYESNQYYLPRGAPSTHILKLPIAGYEDTVANEAFCLALAKAIGLNAVDAEIVTIGEVNYLLVKRYDRIKTDGVWKRLHQEDMCQALSIAPENKYQQEGGPGIKAMIKLIKQHSHIPVKDIQQCMNQLIFSYYIGNRDAHGKNYSFVYQEEGLTLTPQYDVLRTEAYEQLSRKMAMRIGTCYDSDQVSEKDWNALAEENAINKTYLKNVRADIRSSIVSKMDVVIDAVFKTVVPPIILRERDRILKTIDRAGEK